MRIVRTKTALQLITPHLTIYFTDDLARITTKLLKAIRTSTSISFPNGRYDVTFEPTRDHCSFHITTSNIAIIASYPTDELTVALNSPLRQSVDTSIPN